MLTNNSLDTSNLGFDLSPCIKGPLGQIIKDSDNQGYLFNVPTDIEPLSLVSFMEVADTEGVWKIAWLEIYEVQKDRSSLIKIGNFVFGTSPKLLTRDEEKLIKRWQREFEEYYEKNSGFSDLSSFGERYLELAEQVSPLLAQYFRAVYFND